MSVANREIGNAIQVIAMNHEKITQLSCHNSGNYHKNILNITEYYKLTKKKHYQLINEYKSKYFYGFMDSMKPTHKHGNKLNKKH